MKQVGNTILAKGVNHILAKRDNSAWPKGSKLSGFSNLAWKSIIKLLNGEMFFHEVWLYNLNMLNLFESAFAWKSIIKSLNGEMLFHEV